ncbi:hypothetical protein [Raineyella fluvialis]|uniref:Uncharacterized protein n=1 Tax=Raineyella fluvialis TaxID=2662261 RepID=A0A5Q2F7Y5_9ACTN|nr:hypothetical protein [Raineyella fluvialis]QGF22571.1 hypothetical protein Rai3103_01480 [Raineyella fluvialis]
MQAGLSHPLTYVLSEMANLLGACGPSIVIGVAALILAIRAPMPTWLRVFSVLASVCGITAPLYFTFYVFVLWCLVLAAWLVAPRREARVTEPGPSLVG